MGTKQQELYDQVKKGIAEELDKLENKNLTILQEMTINLRLRQVTASPNILNSDNIPSAKLQQSCGLKYSHSEMYTRKKDNYL